MSTSSTSVPGQRIFCVHCGETVSRRTFYEHKKNYYDPDSKTWTKKCRRESALSDPTMHECGVPTDLVSSCNEVER